MVSKRERWICKKCTREYISPIHANEVMCPGPHAKGGPQRMVRVEPEAPPTQPKRSSTRVKRVDTVEQLTAALQKGNTK